MRNACPQRLLLVERRGHNAIHVDVSMVRFVGAQVNHFRFVDLRQAKCGQPSAGKRRRSPRLASQRRSEAALTAESRRPRPRGCAILKSFAHSLAKKFNRSGRDEVKLNSCTIRSWGRSFSRGFWKTTRGFAAPMAAAARNWGLRHLNVKLRGGCGQRRSRGTLLHSIGLDKGILWRRRR